MKQFLAFAGGTLIYAASKADALVAAATPDTLADGAIGLFARSGTDGKLILVDAAADFADVKGFVVARGTATGAILSDEIERKTLAVDKNAAVAGTQKVVKIQNIPANLPKGTVVEVGVTDKTSTITTDYRVKSGSYTTTVANQAASVIAAGLAASINKKDVPGTAVADGNDLSFTVDAGKDATLFTRENLDGATVAVTTPAVNPEGDVASLEALRLECEGYQGRTNYVDRTTGPTKDTDNVIAAGNHVVYNLTWTGTTTRLAVATDAVASRFKRLYLAIPTGATAITTLDTLLVGAAEEEVAAQAEEVGA